MLHLMTSDPRQPLHTHEQEARESEKDKAGANYRVGAPTGKGCEGGEVAQKPQAHGLSTSRAVGIVLRDVSSPFFSLIVRGVEAAASESGFDVLLSSTSGQPEKEESQILHYRNMGISGIVIASMTHVYTASDALRQIHDDKFPYVLVSYVEEPDIYHVGTDHERGGYIATRHLLERGYRKIGYVGGEVGNRVGELRRQGYLRALLDFDIPYRPSFEFHLRLRGEWNDYQSGLEIGHQIAWRPDRPAALFVYNDLTALGIQQALLQDGIRIPDDIAMVGFDDIGQAQLARVPLTTIHQPTFEIGAAAFDVIQKRMHGVEVAVRTILDPSLVVRESCGASGRHESHTS